MCVCSHTAGVGVESGVVGGRVWRVWWMWWRVNIWGRGGRRLRMGSRCVWFIGVVDNNHMYIVRTHKIYVLLSTKLIFV